VNSFVQVEVDYNLTFSKKAHEFEFPAMEGVTHISWNFTSTLVIVSNLHHVDSLSQQKKQKTCEKKLQQIELSTNDSSANHHVDSLSQLKNKKLVKKNYNKLNYQQTTLVQTIM